MGKIAMDSQNKISPSRISTWLRCETWHFNKYIQRLEPEIKDSSLPFLTGNLIHDCIADWIQLGKKDAPLPSVTGYLESFINKNPGKFSFVEKLPILESLKRIQNLAEVIKSEICSRFTKILLSEEHLQLQLPSGVIFHGYPDIVGVCKEGEITLVDIKIGGKLKSQGDVNGMFNQLAGYAWLLDINGIPASRVEVLTGSISSAAKPRGNGYDVTWVPFDTAAFAQDFQHNLRIFSDFIFFKSPSRRTGLFNGSCGFCAYRGHCLGRENKGKVKVDKEAVA
ncbi:RecB family exonuclease [Candidatus Riflebacteria bacterium]